MALTRSHLSALHRDVPALIDADRSPAQHGTDHPITDRVACGLLERLSTALSPQGKKVRWTFEGADIPPHDLVHAQRWLPIWLAVVASVHEPRSERPVIAITPFAKRQDGVCGLELGVRVMNPCVDEALLDAWTTTWLDWSGQQARPTPAATTLETTLVEPGTIVVDLGAAGALERWWGGVIQPILNRHDDVQQLANQSLDRLEHLVSTSASSTTNHASPEDLSGRLVSSADRKEQTSHAVNDMQAAMAYPQHARPPEEIRPEKMVDVLQDLMNRLGEPPSSPRSDQNMPLLAYLVTALGGKLPTPTGGEGWLSLAWAAPFPSTDAGLQWCRSQDEACSQDLGGRFPLVRDDGQDWTKADTVVHTFSSGLSTPTTGLKNPATIAPYAMFQLGDRVTVCRAMQGLDPNDSSGWDVPDILAGITDLLKTLSVRQAVGLMQGLLPPPARDAQVLDRLRTARWDDTSVDDPFQSGRAPSNVQGTEPVVDEVERLALQTVDRVIDDDGDLNAAVLWFNDRIKAMDDDRTFLAVDALRRALARYVPRLSFPSQDDGEKRRLITDVKKKIVHLLRDNNQDVPQSRRDAILKGLFQPSDRNGKLAPQATKAPSEAPEASPAKAPFPLLDVEQQRFKPCRGTVGEFNDHARFKVLTDNTPLRTVGMDPWAWQDAMDRAFPWMSDLTARLVRRLSIQLTSGLPLQLPLIALLGESGVGKTLYWIEAMRLLDHPFIVQGMSGVNDSVVIKGTPAGWSNARPGLAATAMASLTCGNPVILLDELDKGHGSDRNGNAQEALLPLLEQATARQYRDDCLQMAVDASHISWIVTLNDEDRLSPALRSRLDIIEVKGPDWANPVHVNAALTLGEQLAWDAWPARMRTPETRLSAPQQEQLRRTRWASLRSLGHAIRTMVEENLYQVSVDRAMVNRPAAAQFEGWRPTPGV